MVLLSILKHSNRRAVAAQEWISAGFHLDILLHAGHRCQTWSMYPQHRVLHQANGEMRYMWQLNKPHRRFYLDYSGPVSQQRGVVRPLWTGPVQICGASGLNQSLTIKNRQFIISLHANGLATIQTGHRLPKWLAKRP